MFSGDYFGNLLVWDIRGGACSGQWSLGVDAVNAIALDPGKTVCACATDSCTITLLDPNSHKVG